jgi:pyruvate-formate lyase-activating enzyme
MPEEPPNWTASSPVALRLDYLYRTVPAAQNASPGPDPEMPPLPAVDPALLEPGLITDIRLDLTSRCNLRCVYCAVSEPDYAGEDMSTDVVGHAIDFLRQISRYHEISGVGINGHGETTLLPHWTAACRDIAALGLPVSIITNFANSYSTEELEALALLHTISISIDTADRALLRRIRRHVDVRQIVSNVVAVRAAALRRNRPQPRFQFFCGLYDKNTLQIEELAWLAVALNIQKMQFWNLFVHSYEGLKIPEADQVYPLASLTDDDLLPRMQAVARAVAVLRKAEIAVEIDGPFIAELGRRVGVHV